QSQCLAASTTTSITSSSSVGTTSTSTSSSTSATSTPTAPVDVNYWFSFGDSYTQTDFDPNSTLPAVGNPLGNPPYPGYTATGGVNWVDLVTTEYNTSLVFTYNYAYGGATINASLVAPYESSVLSLGDQINEFLEGAGTQPAATPWTSANSLFSIWIGINDIGNSYNESGDRGAFNDVLLANEFALVQELCRYQLKLIYSNVGARNFLFVTVPPINDSPLMIAEGASACAAEAVVIADFNTKLVEQASSFQANNSGVTTYIWDANAQFTTILANPTAYGFIDNVTVGSDPDDFWGNTYHPSSYAHQFFGEEVGTNVLGNTIW
ncbi:hypothetical protein H0H92_012541, partial [Tricholoma furcatifolium]